jgi:NAD(P)-dependent dehydrogenase (short-subunit alcohol dehydrogenase family)
MNRLEGKSILVAGGGGIGAELARRYAQEGAGVVLGDLDLDGARGVAEEIERSGGRARAVRLDGADEDSVAAAVALCCEAYGGLDGLHANFASFADGAPDVGALDLRLEDYDETMRVNARGYLLCTRQALRALIARGGGSILYTSSGAAHLGEPTRVAYAMSKAAGHALMRHVAARYGRDGVRANCIAPGVIVHERMKTALGPDFTALAEWALAIAQLKSRPGHPDDIAAMSALLMSDEGSFVTGQVISVDGGATMRP